MQEAIASDVLFLIGAAIVFSFAGAAIMRKVGIPQTLGFMLVGILLGLFGIANEELVHSLRLIVSLALGLIGYNIGHELRSDELEGRIRKLAIIVIFEATAAFLVVSIITYLIVQQWHVSLLLGALASATAPAATADVVWEHGTQGELSSSIMFVLAADDIAAVILTNSAMAYALWIFIPDSTTLLEVILVPLSGIGVAALLGGVFGFVFLKFVNRERDRGKLLELELGLIIFLIGLSLVLGVSEIFSCIVFGFLVGKYIDEDKEPVPVLVQRIMSPIVMIFFVLVGARMAHLLTAGSALTLIVITAILYLGGRTVAKYVGARIGAMVVGESEKIRKYLGSSLLCQAGVALGLSFLVEETLVAIGGEAASIGIMILGVVAVSTIVLEAVGPIAVKHSLRQAGELPEGEVYLEPHEITTIARCGVDFVNCSQIEQLCKDCPHCEEMEASGDVDDTPTEETSEEWFAD
ncbi:MAG: cation:proton antiporter [Candidatus Thorarchaeota archaeon]